MLYSCASGKISMPTSAHDPVTLPVTRTETDELTQTDAIEVVKDTCDSFRTVQLEEPDVNQILIMSPDDADEIFDDEAPAPSFEQFTTRMWFVQLKGKWIGTGTFSGLTKDQPWDICEGLVDAASGDPISMSFRWKKSDP